MIAYLNKLWQTTFVMVFFKRATQLESELCVGWRVFSAPLINSVLCGKLTLLGLEVQHWAQHFSQWWWCSRKFQMQLLTGNLVPTIFSYVNIFYLWKRTGNSIPIQLFPSKENAHKWQLPFQGDPIGRSHPNNNFQKTVRISGNWNNLLIHMVLA